MFWGRRNPPGTPDFPSLNQHETHAFIWDPANPNAAAKPTSNQPTDSQGNSINLFCSGHTFLADGRLLVTGGHLFDSQGLDCSTFYDPVADTWTPGPTMNNGRWYPTAVTLPDGRVFVCSGSFPTGPSPATHQCQTRSITFLKFSRTASGTTSPISSDFRSSRASMSPQTVPCSCPASLATTYLFRDFAPGNPGTWVPVATRSAGNSDYAPSVMYDVGKVIFIGGGAPLTSSRSST